MLLKTFILTLISTQPIRGSSSHLRGFFATKFNDYSLLHQHNTDKFIYNYPLVQYKMINKTPTVIGINDGADVLTEIYDKYDEIRLKNNVYEIVERGISYKNEEFCLSDKFHTYSFETPWFALNQENFTDRYKKIGSTEQKELLRKTLVGNILSMSKSLGYTVPGQIKCETNLHPSSGRMKGVEIATFKGEFMVNFLIPDSFGLGKSVSRGFGTVKRCSL
ncbi:CRISPR-associated endonuclease Cas6 [Methanosarcina sp. Z-7115]|uniref:CRISPR-associated endonuclease Cas6 n=1 Tax=Methanosarcina baikalica TaxID=3073890 RepID=A0ABU2D043_9EURY|nr:CRISPR-associated endonuclease Cas6 [Methanosarcina sp. Z-7115]MDR7665202.1 CRISPR-associated endonuclease Cas6 [Methanosarcina sp. Z-7115]